MTDKPNNEANPKARQRQRDAYEFPSNDKSKKTVKSFVLEEGLHKQMQMSLESKPIDKTPPKLSARPVRNRASSQNETSKASDRSRRIGDEGRGNQVARVRRETRKAFASAKAGTGVASSQDNKKKGIVGKGKKDAKNGKSKQQRGSFR